MANGLNLIVTYLDANFVLIVGAVFAYCLWREIGAAAVGGVGQLFVNAGSLSWDQTISDPAQLCAPVWNLIAILPAVLFAVLPTALNEISQRRGRNYTAVDFMVFWSLFFAAGFANALVLALMVANAAADIVDGCFLLSVLFGGAAVMMGKLGNLGLQRSVTSDFKSRLNDTSAFKKSIVDNSPAPRVRDQSDAQLSMLLQASPIVSSRLPSLALLAQVPGRARPSVVSPIYLFNRNEFFIFRAEHLKDLEDLLRREPPGVLEGLHVAICRRLCRAPIEGDERGFVQAYVVQFRRRLEASYPAYFVPDRLVLAAA